MFSCNLCHSLLNKTSDQSVQSDVRLLNIGLSVWVVRNGFRN